MKLELPALMDEPETVQVFPIQLLEIQETSLYTGGSPGNTHMIRMDSDGSLHRWLKNEMKFIKMETKNVG